MTGEALLTVRLIAEHLELNDWQVIYAIDRSDLPGRKLRGVGGWGRGGSWRISWAAYLDWLHVPDSERAGLAPGQLPPIVRQQVIAARAGMADRQLNAFREQRGIPGRRIGRNDVLLTETAARDLAESVRKAVS